MYKPPNVPRKLADLLEDSIVLFVAGLRHCAPIVLLVGIASAAVNGWMFLRFIDATEGAVDAAAAMAAARAANTPLQFVAQFGTIVAGVFASLAVVAILLDLSRGDSFVDGGSHFRAAWRALPAALLATLLMIVACCAGFLLLVLPGIYVTFRLMLWSVALMDRRDGAVDALRTSWRLVGGHWWRTVGVVMGITLGFAVLAVIVAVPVQWLGPSIAENFRTHVILTLVTNAALQTIGLPLMSASLVVLYRDLQLRLGAEAPQGRRDARALVAAHERREQQQPM